MMKDILKQLRKDELDSVKIIHLLEEWRKVRKGDATAAKLLDICCHVGGDRSSIEAALSSVHGSYIGQLVDRPANAVSGENKDINEATAAIEVDRSDSDIPNQLIHTIAKVAPDKWKIIGINLGVKLTTLLEYENGQDSAEGKVHGIIRLEWKREQGVNGTIGHLLDACEDANVIRGVLEELRAKHNMTVRDS